MPRPRKCREINIAPEVTYFKPRGVPLRELAEVYLPLDGFESIRLADLDGLAHEEAAQRMRVSRQTFGRILAAARNTVAKAIVGGLALRIQGGDYRACQTTAAGDAMPVSARITQPDKKDYPAQPQKREDKDKEHPLMETIIAISSQGPTLDDEVDPRFGRAAGFILVNPASLSFQYVENGAAQARAQGAGIQAAETVAGSGATAVLTGYVGPKAFQALAAAGVKIAQDLENLTVRQAIEKYKNAEVIWADLSQAKGMGR